MHDAICSALGVVLCAALSSTPVPRFAPVCHHPFADVDGDRDVDMDDFAAFQRCYGNGAALDQECRCLDRDVAGASDGVIDASDFHLFRTCASGPAIPAAPMCGVTEGGDPGWSYSRDLRISHPQAGLLARVQLDAGNFDFDLAQANGSDLRFLDNSTILPCWRESWDPAAKSAVVWVRLGSNADILKMLYGNPAAVDTSSGAETFELFNELDSFRAPISHADGFLSTPTPYDTESRWQPPGQVVHPSVRDFGPTGWRGYRYWMAICSYPKSNNTVETILILASHDGLDWVNPSASVNPVYGYYPGFAEADPHLIYNESTDELWLYWLKQDAQSPYELSWFMLTRSGDGVNWSPAAPVMQFLASEAPEPTIPAALSPVILKSNDVWNMWAVRVGGGGSTLLRWNSSDGLNWENPTTCYMRYPRGTLWHMDIVAMADGRLFMTYTNGSKLSIALSSDGGITWDNTLGYMMLPSASAWDNMWLYRSSFLVQDDLFRLWYTAKSRDIVWHLGYTEAPVSRLLGIFSGLEWTRDAEDEGFVFSANGALNLRQKNTGQTFACCRSPISAGVFEVDLHDAWGDQSSETSTSALPCLAVLRLVDATQPDPMKEAGVGIAPNFGGAFRKYYMSHDRDSRNGAGINGPARSVGWHRLKLVVPGDGSTQAYLDDQLLRSYPPGYGVPSVSEVRLLTDRHSVPAGVTWTHQFRRMRVRNYTVPEPIATVGPRSG